jgi:hypothetical protein
MTKAAIWSAVSSSRPSTGSRSRLLMAWPPSCSRVPTICPTMTSSRVIPSGVVARGARSSMSATNS